MVSEVTNGSVKMSNLVRKMSIGLFKLGTSGFTVMKSNLKVVAFNSTGVKLFGEIMNCGVEMGDLVSKSSVG